MKFPFRNKLASSVVAVSLLSSSFHFNHVQATSDGNKIQRKAAPVSTTNVDIKNHNALHLRSGASRSPCCSDSYLVLAGKTAFSVGLEGAGLLGVLWAGQKLAVSTRIQTALPVWLALCFIIFRSSTVKTLIDGSFSAATAQVLSPTTTPGDPVWYSNLKKPWFNPPGWLFPVMWLVVSKPTQLWGVSRLVLRNQQPNSAIVWPALSLYTLHLALGDAWNQVFFGCQRVGLGAMVIGVFWGMLAASAWAFYRIDPTAGLFLLPTLAWVSVATALNVRIYQLNKKG